MAKDELEELVVADADALRAWLNEHHQTSPGVWLALAKMGGQVTSLVWQEAVDEGLCFGWIDGQTRKRDEETMSIRFTPRGTRSVWSQRNVANVARLHAEGRMQPSGLAVVEAARADGRWDRAYAPSSELVIPDDLAAAVAGEPEAQRMFGVLTKSNQVALVHRLGNVKRAATRERKIAEYVAMLARHQTIYPQKAKPAAD